MVSEDEIKAKTGLEGTPHFGTEEANMTQVKAVLALHRHFRQQAQALALARPEEDKAGARSY
jgi:hypothetical protein